MLHLHQQQLQEQHIEKCIRSPWTSAESFVPTRSVSVPIRMHARTRCETVHSTFDPDLLGGIPEKDKNCST